MEAAEFKQDIQGALTAQEEGLRRSLVSYMESEGIGVAELYRRIAKRTAGSLADIKLEVLAPFLAGQEAPARAMERRCAEFAEGARAADGLVSFGDELCAFGQAIGETDVLAALAGRYAVAAYAGPDGDALEYGVIKFEPVEGQPFLRAVLIEPDAEAGSDYWSDGVALVQAHGVSVILRDALTRRLQVLMLSTDGGGLSGALMTPGYDGRSGRGASVLDVTLTRTAGL